MNVRPILLLCAPLALSACQAVPGDLTISEPIELEARAPAGGAGPGCPTRDACGETNPRKTVIRLHPGRYPARIELDAEDAVTLVIGDGAGRASTVSFAVPEDVRFPRDHGSFQLEAESTGQPFNLSVSLNTRRSRSALRSGEEHCQYGAHRRFCKAVRLSAGGGSEVRCFDRWITVPGSREVAYRVIRETRRVHLNLTRAGQERSVARFEGAVTDAGREYDYRGFCHPARAAAGFHFW